MFYHKCLIITTLLLFMILYILMGMAVINSDKTDLFMLIINTLTSFGPLFDICGDMNEFIINGEITRLRIFNWNVRDYISVIITAIYFAFSQVRIFKKLYNGIISIIFFTLSMQILSIKLFNVKKKKTRIISNTHMVHLTDFIICIFLPLPAYIFLMRDLDKTYTLILWGIMITCWMQYMKCFVMYGICFVDRDYDHIGVSHTYNVYEAFMITYIIALLCIDQNIDPYVVAFVIFRGLVVTFYLAEHEIKKKIERRQEAGRRAVQQEAPQVNYDQNEIVQEDFVTLDNKSYGSCDFKQDICVDDLIPISDSE